jgi:Protein of unknown function (DUF3455)
VVEVFDISCLYGTPEFTTVQDDAYTMWTKTPSFITTDQIISTFGSKSPVLGQHYFIDNPDGSSTISPVWDFTTGAEKGNAAGFILAAVVNELPAPTGSDDVNWVQLKRIDGELADAVYRVDTKAGQPPAEVNKILHNENCDVTAHEFIGSCLTVQCWRPTAFCQICYKIL